MTASAPVKRGRVWLAAGAVLAAAAGVVVLMRPTLPAPGSETYEEVSRAFYHGLAALEVGLLDDARQQFSNATSLVPGEPASWANLGLAQLRLGELDAAAAPIARAVELAPGNRDIVLLAARMEIARGRDQDGIAQLRRAVSLDDTGLQTRFALADELQRGGGEEGQAEAEALYDALLTRAPTNLAVLIERARLAARRRDTVRLADSVGRVASQSTGWPESALEQLQSLQDAAGAGRFDDAVRATALLRNVLARVSAFLEGLSAVRTPAELIGEPLTRFVALVPASARPAPADTSLTFAREALATPAPVQATELVGVDLEAPGTVDVLALDARGLRRLNDGQAVGDSGGGTPPPGSAWLVSLDWNHDFRPDLVRAVSGGVRLLLQGADGRFTDATAQAGTGDAAVGQVSGLWAADVEMDGDVDLVVGIAAGPTRVLRNNGDGTWRAIETFAGVAGARAFTWADLDGDADPDAAFIDGAGGLRVLVNRQAGQFAVLEPPGGAEGLTALAAADLDADGVMDLVTLNRQGTMTRLTRRGGQWEMAPVASWPEAGDGPHRLLALDLDNNGALDLVAAGPAQSRVWLADDTLALKPVAAAIDGTVSFARDLNADGTLDLVGLSSGTPSRWLTRGRLNYHWKTFRTRGQQNAGDQRINSFGVGGEIEVRSGLLWQKQVLAGGVAHFGLGTRTSIDVTRVVWPNGVPQAEFGIAVDDTFVAEQRLKGSCPWVFAYDGHEMAFVTDFLWRSPLGLRINAQDTAGVTQTEDWVKIRGDQLVPTDGAYDVRITAELWETHFFDHVALMVVDHPVDTQVYVDERFSATAPPALAVRALQPPRPVLRATDQAGRDVTALVGQRDGRYVASFERGAYQGIAREHYIEFDLDDRLPRGQPLTLVAQGWVYPTDSSINVAVGQGRATKPGGLALDAQDAHGVWRVAVSDLGFPAGKNKTMLIDLGAVASARRLRLRTNLEVYWDWLAVAPRADVPVRLTRLPLESADLRFRGFSRTSSPRGEAPETPDYGRIANTAQRWRDLVGYHTRFGDVRELLAGVDDRYVIMNAGDEMRLRFAAQPAPAAGWTRDFVLVGDGWEKDGDFNTAFSQTVLPLPSHDRADYGAQPPGELEDDPVYRKHPGDWQRYHTRYVTPERFTAGLARP